MVLHDFSEARTICDNVEKIWYSQPRRMRFACWITKATNTHSEFVMFFAFTQKKCAREAPYFHVYTKIAYPVIDMNVYEDCCTRKLHVGNR